MGHGVLLAPVPQPSSAEAGRSDVDRIDLLPLTRLLDQAGLSARHEPKEAKRATGNGS